MHAEVTTDPAEWGIDAGYEDVHGRWHDAPVATLESVLDALGADPVVVDGRVRACRPAPPVGDVWVVRSGAPVDAGGRYRLRTEDGQDLSRAGVLPADLPTGYHELDLVEEGRTIRLIVSPGRCPDPPRAWGWAAQLYALRSSSSWGFGDLGDLRDLCRWAKGDGAGAVLLNPLNAAAPAGPQEPSPYYPASRVFRNPLYLRVADIEGACAVDGFAEAEVLGRALNERPTIERDTVWALKRPVLEAAFHAFEARGGSAGFEVYRLEQGWPLEAWGAWCVACEMAGPDRSVWPEVSPAVLAAGVEADPDLRRGARFHAWMQWQLDRQLAAAATVGPAIVTDLAIGCDAGGFDTWLWPAAFVTSVRVGAPPDLFAPDGQDWGLPPFDPWALRRLAFDPFVRLVRAGLRHAGGLRMDHVMGLFRLFMVPVGGSPTDGCYLRYPSAELLDILALEAHRAGAFVVGEDLGTVQDEVRDELAARQVLGTKLLWFEDGTPSTWAVGALGAVTTHDLPTVAGAWSGADVEDQRASGAAVAEGAVEALADDLAEASGLDRSAPALDAVVAAHRLLSEAPCAVVLATLEDAAGQVPRPNLPGTTGEQRPNWSIPLPAALEDLPDLPGTKAIIEAMQAARGRSGTSL